YGTRIVVYTVTEFGLTQTFNIPINGCICILKPVKVSGRKESLLFVLTEKYHCFMLGYDIEKKSVKTISTVDIKDRFDRISENGPLCTVDNLGRCIVLSFSQGYVKVIQLDENGKICESFPLRIEALDIVSMTLIPGHNNPLIGMITQDYQEARHFETFEIFLNQKELNVYGWTRKNLERGANHLIGLESAIVMIGEHSIMYFADNGFKKEIEMKPTIVTCVCRMTENSNMFLIGDYKGRLMILTIQGKVKNVNLDLEEMGNTNIPKSITYLDNGFLFIAGGYSDSQLIQLLPKMDENGRKIKIIENFTNISPMTDFVLEQIDQQQSQLICCSGGYEEGSIRRIRNGVGIEELATLELEGIESVFPINKTANGMELDDNTTQSQKTVESLLLLSFANSTRILSLIESEFEQVEYPAFELHQKTIYCKNMFDKILQITTNKLILIHPESFERICELKLETINKVSVSGTVVAVAIGKKVALYKISNEIKEIASMKMENEVSSVGVDDSMLVSVGFWNDCSVRVYNATDVKWKEMFKDESLNVISRSMLFVKNNETVYLMVGMGDGRLVYYNLNEDYKRKIISLGSNHVDLSTSLTGVFASCDHPVMLFFERSKLYYSSINVPNIKSLCHFNSPHFPNSVVYSTPLALTIGSIDDLAKLHIETSIIDCHIRNITKFTPNNIFIANTINVNVIESEMREEKTSSVRVFSYDFRQISEFKLDQHEEASSVSMISIGLEDYVVVGTAYTSNMQDNLKATSGRVLLFKVDSSSNLILISQVKVDGCVYSVRPLLGKIAAAINNKIHIFEYQENTLKPLVTQSGFILIPCMETRDNLILAGDLMRSATLLQFNHAENKIEPVCIDKNNHWSRCLSFIDENSFIIADDNGNILCKKNEEGNCKTIAQYHLGENINVITEGSLVVKSPELENILENTFIFGTIFGTVGVVAKISPDLFEVLAKLQRNLARHLNFAGNISHNEWREFQDDRKHSSSFGMIDGDLIESILTLTPETVEIVVNGSTEKNMNMQAIGYSVEQTIHIVEELSRLK
ncbi:hypothetical protein ROZALSC1DRAFT_29167, partial [Rozella allomycis CSF55]